MPVEQNVELMQRWFREVWNEGRTQTVYDLLSPNAVARGQAGLTRKFTAQQSSCNSWSAFALRSRISNLVSKTPSEHRTR
jgi:hypothetical protein